MGVLHFWGKRRLRLKNKKRVDGGRLVRIARFAVLFAAVIFLVTGIVRKEYLDVFQKAVKICLECIGIG